MEQEYFKFSVQYVHPENTRLKGILSKTIFLLQMPSATKGLLLMPYEGQLNAIIQSDKMFLLLL
jgi:hypothetical protein